MERTGLEPVTFALPVRRAPNCANAPLSIRCPTDHRLAYAMEKSVVGNTTGVALITMNG